MEDLLSKIYSSVVIGESDSVELGFKYDSQVEAIIEPLKETMDEDEIERVRELMYEFSYITEQGGFILGVRFMASFMAEVMGKEVR